LPVSLAPTRQKDACKLADHPDGQGEAVEASVHEAAGEDAEGVEQEELGGADPGDGGGWEVQGVGVVGLKDAVGEGVAEGI